MSELQESRWYVVHTYSGHENKVKATIEKAVKTRGMEQFIQEVVVPTEDVVETTKTGTYYPQFINSKAVKNAGSLYYNMDSCWKDGSGNLTSGTKGAAYIINGWGVEMSFHHADRMNVNFIDGHSEPVTPDQLVTMKTNNSDYRTTAIRYAVPGNNSTLTK